MMTINISLNVRNENAASDHWRSCQIYWEQPKYWGGKVAITDESIGVSQLLEETRARAAPQSLRLCYIVTPYNWC